MSLQLPGKPLIDDECQGSTILGKAVGGSGCGFRGVIGSSIHVSKYDDQLSVGDKAVVDSCLNTSVATYMAIVRRMRNLQVQSQEFTVI